MRGAEHSCRARGNCSQIYKVFLVSGRGDETMRIQSGSPTSVYPWIHNKTQGEPEQRCAKKKKHGFERSSISWLLNSVDIGAENTRDRVMRPSWLQKIYLRGCTILWSATLLDTSGGQVGDPCWKPMLRNFLLNPDTITEEDLVLVCSVQLRIAASARSSL